MLDSTLKFVKLRDSLSYIWLELQLAIVLNLSRFSGSVVSVVEESYRRPGFYIATALTPDGGGPGSPLSPQLPKKTATWGLSRALYGTLYPASNCAGKGSLNLYCRPCCRGNVLVANCKRDQATLAINSAGASAANEVKHRYRNLFQLKLTLLGVALVCKEGGSEKGAWLIRRKALCSVCWHWLE